MLEKLEKIEKNLQYINKNMKGENIIIELTGSPKSGKTTCVQALRTTLEKAGVNFEIRRETAEYNPVDKKSEDYNTWMVMELFKNTIEDIEGKGKIVIYDRGILDRKFWLEQAKINGKMTQNDVNILNSLYNLNLNKKYKPVVVAFKTSPELSIKRKGKESTHINQKTLSLYNSIFDAGQEELKKVSQAYSFFETDGYQGKLKEFIVDVSEKLTTDIVRFLEERDYEIKR